ncbi:hypothetical protein M378DRAFT_164697 [Amanita muscaria Koide BX008]|uniref:Uncharacterized protein n=1 Tax=Amanita muscaria (strain Koide BX008) TaxID=946122 RepID=A0A0C2WP29_AMAMK|nr:hypothetical protein M378DRAFT_164697 [Amanita muscaria Koide BX008]
MAFKSRAGQVVTAFCTSVGFSQKHSDCVDPRKVKTLCQVELTGIKVGQHQCKAMSTKRPSQL